jgi:hypothetical protein
MVSGGGRLRPQEDTLNNPIDMVVGTPGRVLQHIEEGNIVYGDIKYVVSIRVYKFMSFHIYDCTILYYLGCVHNILYVSIEV